MHVSLFELTLASMVEDVGTDGPRMCKIQGVLELTFVIQGQLEVIVHLKASCDLQEEDDHGTCDVESDTEDPPTYFQI